MTDQPPTPPFAFQPAKPASPKPVKTVTKIVHKAVAATGEASKPRQRKPRAEPAPEKSTTRRPKSVRVDLMHAIEAAASLHETDATVFAAAVKLLNQQPTASRRRVAVALARVFG